MRNSPLPRMSRRGRVTVGVLVGVFLLFTLLGLGHRRVHRLLWFDEVDFTSVFTGVLTHPAAALPGRRARDGAGGRRRTSTSPTGCGRCCVRTRPEQATLERYRMVLDAAPRHLDRRDRPRHRLLRRPLRAGPVEGVAALPERAAVRGPDPQFNVDIGFYVFDYPLWRYLLGVALHRGRAVGDRLARRALHLRRRAAAGRR